MQGYEDKPPAGFNLPEGSYYNNYFPGHAIKMPKPLNDGQVTYDDGSPATVAQYAKDVTTFLMWTAEPHMEARKALGLQVFVFLILLTVLAVLHQEEGLGQRPLITGVREFRKSPCGGFFVAFVIASHPALIRDPLAPLRKRFAFVAGNDGIIADCFLCAARPK